ncbi:solute carrier family 25 member 16-like isoform X2 [Montipora foliosa]|uniref:solute carrier family 25 member 16-like isoform X1 n=1 Tax=Montipora foliosa TaxID=591990 RepID=UPI0035F19748
MEERKQMFVFSTVLSGGLSTCCARTAAAPLERLKILFQGQNQHFRNEGLVEGLRKIYYKEGVAGFYRGNGAMMVRTFPHGAVQFVSYEQYKQFLESLFGKGSVSHLISGSLAGLTACSVTYPLDTVRCRLAFQVADERVYLGICHALKKISSSEGGYVALYRGFCTQSFAMIPMIGLSFLIFERMKDFLISMNGILTRFKSDTLETVLSSSGILACGATAGVLSQTVAYPLDVTKRRLQLAGIHDCKKYRHCFTTLMTIYKEHGIVRGLYRGLTLNYLRVIPQVSVMFWVYELSRQLLTS